MKLYERIENNNFDEIDKNRAIELIEGGNGHLVYNENYFKLQKENEELNKKIKEQKECAFREGGTEECLWYCSNCHNEWLFYEGTPEENNLKYCPHCGAKVIKEEKETVEELRKQLRLAINIDDITTTIRNDDAETILNLIEKLQKENEELKQDNSKQWKERCRLSFEVDDSISKQVLRDKIKELSDNKDFDGDVYVEEYAVDVLKELLGDE